MRNLLDQYTTEQPTQALRLEAQRKLDKSPPPSAQLRSTDELLEELQIHQIELEMQNESLRQSQIELEQSRDRYRDLYEFSPIGYITLNRFGVITEINLTATALLGRDRDSLLKRHFAPLVASYDTDRWYLFVKDALKKATTSTLELTLNLPDGSPLMARIDCLSLKSATMPASLRIALTDISASKQAELELRVAAIAFESKEAMMVTDCAGLSCE